MTLLVKQLYLAKDDVVKTTGDFETIQGIPCYHSLRVMQRLNVKVTKHDFHKHSHFERPVNAAKDGEQIELLAPPPAPPAPTISAPHTVVTRGRQRRGRTIGVIPLNLSCRAHNFIISSCSQNLFKLHRSSTDLYKHAKL